MHTEYSKGFKAGRDYAYAWAIELINSHLDAGATLTMQEIVREIEWVAYEEERLQREADIRRLCGND